MGRERNPDELRVRIKGAWTACPNRLLLDTRLSRDARLLGCLLFVHAGNKENAFPKQELLAAELSRDGTAVLVVRSIQRWLIELRDAGWLEWQQTQKNNRYTLLDPVEAHDNRLIRATGESSRIAEETVSNTTEGSLSNATEGSPRATAQSPSTTTAQSPSTTTEGSLGVIAVSSSTTTEGSLGVIAVSCPSYIKEDSLEQESSSETQADDGDDVVVFLRNRGVTAATEFAGLDFAAVYERVEQLERDQRCTPGGIVANLRRAPPQARAPAEPSTLTDTERVLHQRAADLAETLEATGLEYQTLLRELALGASDDAARTALEAKRIGRTQRY